MTHMLWVHGAVGTSNQVSQHYQEFGFHGTHQIQSLYCAKTHFQSHQDFHPLQLGELKFQAIPASADLLIHHFVIDYWGMTQG